MQVRFLALLAPRLLGNLSKFNNLSYCTGPRAWHFPHVFESPSLARAKARLDTTAKYELAGPTMLNG